MVPGSKSTRTARGTYLLPDACRISVVSDYGYLAALRRTGPTHLVEVDVHALELELGGAVVPIEAVSGGFIDRESATVTYTPLLSRPCSPEMVCLEGKSVLIGLDTSLLDDEAEHTRKRHRFGYPREVACQSIRSIRSVAVFESIQLTHWPVWRWTWSRKIKSASCTFHHGSAATALASVGWSGNWWWNDVVPVCGVDQGPKKHPRRVAGYRGRGKVCWEKRHLRFHAFWRFVYMWSAKAMQAAGGRFKVEVLELVEKQRVVVEKSVGRGDC
jgi:hypothetical protein